jgi:hypothetical protein
MYHIMNLFRFLDFLQFQSVSGSKSFFLILYICILSHIVLTLEDGQIRPKHVVVLKILKWQVLRTLKSVLDVDKPHKRRKKERESPFS